MALLSKCTDAVTRKLVELDQTYGHNSTSKEKDLILLDWNIPPILACKLKLSGSLVQEITLISCNSLKLLRWTFNEKEDPLSLKIYKFSNRRHIWNRANRTLFIPSIDFWRTLILFLSLLLGFPASQFTNIVTSDEETLLCQNPKHQISHNFETLFLIKGFQIRYYKAMTFLLGT